MVCDDPVVFQARASRGGYIVFGVLYFPMVAAMLVAFARGRLQGQEYILLLPLLLLVPTYLPLLAFKIKITTEYFEYRDGLWRVHRCHRSSITGVENVWVEFSRLGRVLRIPRLVIRCKNAPEDTILINSKPFSREALKQLREILGGAPKQIPAAGR
jgi:hypothetical protein